MSEESWWERLRNELDSPWDWVAAGAGATAGFGASIALHGIEGGTSAATGALAAVTCRKAAAAGLEGRSLRRRAKSLLAMIANERGLSQLYLRIERDLRLWSERIIENAQFADLLDDYVDEYRRLS